MTSTYKCFSVGTVEAKKYINLLEVNTRILIAALFEETDLNYLSTEDITLRFMPTTSLADFFQTKLPTQVERIIVLLSVR